MNITEHQIRNLLENIPNILNENSVIKISPGCDKSDGYNSYLYKVTINNFVNKTNISNEYNFNNGQHELIIKCAPEDEYYRKLMTVQTLYLSEIYVYDTILPEFYKLESKNSLKIIPIIPKYIMSITTPYKETLILEDVRQFGYKMRDKKRFLDEEHLSFALKEFAKFHAFSFGLKQKNSELYTKLVQRLKDIHGSRHCNLNDEFNSWYQSPLKQLMELFQSPEDVETLKRLDDIKEHLEEYLEKIYEYDGEFGVVSHMDCWSNNMLFKYKDTKLESICFLDFQYVYVVSPVVDFVYLLYVNGKPDEYQKFQKYATLYYETLGDTLKLLRLNIENVYPRNVFEEELISYGKYGFLRALMGVPMTMRDEKDTIDVKDVVDQGLESCSAFGVEKWSPKCKDWMRKLTIHVIAQHFI